MASQALAPRNDNSPAALRGALVKMENEFKMALPAHITPEKFQRTVMTAVQTDPKLLTANRMTLFRSCMKAAQDGLLPDGREAALVIFRTKIDGQFCDAVQYMPMVYGLRKKILQSGEISNLQTGVVYRAEFEAGAFSYEIGAVPPLTHRPILDLPTEEMGDDKIIAAYSIATMKDGTLSFEVMRRAEIDKVRAVSKTGSHLLAGDKKPSGPWVDWFSEMARKTVMRRHSKTLPMNSDIIDIEAREDIDHARSAAMLLASPPAEPRGRLDDLEDAVAAGDNVDRETGEVLSESDDRTVVDAILASIGKIELAIDVDAFEATIPSEFEENTEIVAALAARRAELSGGDQ